MRTIKLKSNGLGRYDNVSPFILTDNKLELKIELPNLNGEFYLIAENNGKTFEKRLSSEESVILDSLTAGELHAEVKHYLKGVFIKTYKIEPLILCEVGGSLSGTPEIIALQAQISELNKSFKEYKATAEKHINKLENKVCALIRFALKDYENNVYLDGGCPEKFFEEFGLELADEEIKLIKGEKKNADEN